MTSLQPQCAVFAARPPGGACPEGYLVDPDDPTRCYAPVDCASFCASSRKIDWLGIVASGALGAIAATVATLAVGAVVKRNR